MTCNDSRPLWHEWVATMDEHGRCESDYQSFLERQVFTLRDRVERLEVAITPALPGEDA